jgi:hypothetical protein
MVLPEIRLLQATIVLAEELHFSRAADRLNMSQSSSVNRYSSWSVASAFRSSNTVIKLLNSLRQGWSSSSRRVKLFPMRNGQFCPLGPFSMGRMKSSISASRPIPNRFSFQRFYPFSSHFFPR